MHKVKFTYTDGKTLGRGGKDRGRPFILRAPFSGKIPIGSMIDLSFGVSCDHAMAVFRPANRALELEGGSKLVPPGADVKLRLHNRGAEAFLFEEGDELACALVLHNMDVEPVDPSRP